MRGKNFNALGALSSHASNMITSIKNNSRRKELDHFKKSENTKTNTKLKFKNVATSEEIEEIKQKIKRKNSLKLKRNIVIFVISIAIAIYVIGFVKF